MKFSICIPTFNRSNDLRIMFKSLSNQTYKNFNVIVIDRFSTDDTIQVVQEYQNQFPIYFFQLEAGLAASQNFAISKADGDIFLRTDDDAEFSPDVLEKLHLCLIDDNSAGASVVTYTPNKNNRHYFLIIKKLIFLKPKILSRFLLCFIFGKNYLSINKFNTGGIRSFGSNTFLVNKKESFIEVDELEATSMAIKMDLIKVVNGFDENFVGIGDFNEADLCLRIIKKTKKKLILCNQSYCIHHVSTSGSYVKRIKCHDRISNYIYFYLKNFNYTLINKINFIKYIIILFLNYFYISIKRGYLLNFLLEFMGAVFSGFKRYYKTSRSKRY